MAIPSHTPMVLTWSGVPPAMRTPALTASAICCRWIWPGMTSFWAETTATSGRSSSSSVSPSALSRLRCGARARPRLIMSLLSCMLSSLSLVRCEKCEAQPRSRHGGRRHAVLLGAAAGWPGVRAEVLASCSRECSGPSGAGSHAARSLWDGCGPYWPCHRICSWFATLRGACFRGVIARERQRFDPKRSFK